MGTAMSPRATRIDGDRAPRAQTQPFPAPLRGSGCPCLGKLCAVDGWWQHRPRFPGRMRQSLPAGRGGAAVGAAARLGWGRQPALSRAVVGALVCGAAGGRHPQVSPAWWCRANPPKSMGRTHKPAPLHTPTGCSHLSRPSPRVGREPVEPLMGEQGVVAECWAHRRRQESGFLVALVPCIPCVVPRPAS